MSLIGVEGTIVDPRDGNMQWKIPESKMMLTMCGNYYYRSPSFYFLKSCWRLTFYANGDKNNEGFFTVHFVQHSTQARDPLTLNICLNLSLDNMKNESRIKHRMKTATHTFSNDDQSYVWGEIIKSDKVWTNEPKSSAITISCFATEGSLPIFAFYQSMSRKTHVSEDFKKFYDGQREDTDVTFKVQKRIYKAHKLILGIRSPEFSRLFEKDRNKHGFKVDKCDPDTFNMLLQFLYTGTLEELPLEKVRSLYIAATYWYKDLARICARYMAHIISEDTYESIQQLAASYKDKLLLEATAAFYENKM